MDIPKADLEKVSNDLGKAVLLLGEIREKSLGQLVPDLWDSLGEAVYELDEAMDEIETWIFAEEEMEQADGRKLKNWITWAKS